LVQFLEAQIMKKNLKMLLWLSVSAIVAVGCADNRNNPSVSYRPGLSDTYTPTSGSDVQRAYPTDPSNVNVTAPPPGAGGQDWALAQQIQSVLMSDRHIDSHVAAVVKDGVVTLHGGVKSKTERERIRDEVGRIPGVVRVDDQLGAGDPTGRGSSTTQNY
jgi:hypothetical protein